MRFVKYLYIASKKNMIKFLGLTALILLLASCDAMVKKVEVVTDNKFKLQLPDYLADVKGDLNDEAQLQYMNGLREVYFVALYEPKSEFDNYIEIGVFEGDESDSQLDIYADLLNEMTEESSENYKLKQRIDTVINGNSAIVCHQTKKVDGIDTYFVTAFVQGVSDYYQIYSWTLLERKDRYKSQLEEMIFSFQEI